VQIVGTYISAHKYCSMRGNYAYGVMNVLRAVQTVQAMATDIHLICGDN